MRQVGKSNLVLCAVLAVSCNVIESPGTTPPDTLESVNPGKPRGEQPADRGAAQPTAPVVDRSVGASPRMEDINQGQITHNETKIADVDKSGNNKRGPRTPVEIPKIFLDDVRECARERMGQVLKLPGGSRWLRADTKQSVIREWESSTKGFRIVNIWATWCKPCLEEIPFLLHISDLLENGINGSLILISDDTDVGEIDRFRELSGESFDTFVTNEKLRAWLGGETGDAPALPVTLVLDSKGKIRGCVSGQLKAQDVERLLMLGNLVQ